MSVHWHASHVTARFAKLASNSFFSFKITKQLKAAGAPGLTNNYFLSGRIFACTHPAYLMCGYSRNYTYPGLTVHNLCQSKHLENTNAETCVAHG